MKRNRPNVDEVLKKHLPWPTQEETEARCDRVLQDLRAGADAPLSFPIVSRSRSNWQRFAMIPAVAGVVLAVVVSLMWRQDALAIGESVDGSLYRVVDGKALPLKTGEKIGIGDTVRTAEGDGGLIRLTDGSRVEMRSQSEVLFEGTRPAVEILMNRGGLIVEGQHLSVRTKDVTVSLAGTVFMNAEEEGSRVGVIQGEVQVQEGAIPKTLRPGEQVATRRLAYALSLPEEIAWSRYREEHLALLQQATPRQPEARVEFEVVSIRPGADPAAGVNGRGGNLPFGFGCGGGSMQLDPRRLVMVTNVYTLVAMAYGKACVTSAQNGLLSGGPSWAKSDQFTIIASMPEGSPAYTRLQFMDGNAPRLQQMLQTMLAERFKLTVRRETRQMDGYALVVGKNGFKLMPAKEGSCDPDGGAVYPGQLTPGLRLMCIRMYTLNYLYHFDLQARSASMEILARTLTASLSRPVIDRTGITGIFDIALESSPADTIYQNSMSRAPADTVNLPSIFEVLEKETGLKLESTKVPVEVLIIDRIERPSEN